VNVGLFPSARVHDVWAVYHGDRWRDRAAEGAELAPGVRLWETPGHTPQDISTVVDTEGGAVVSPTCGGTPRWRATPEVDLTDDARDLAGPRISTRSTPTGRGCSRWRT
jgi:glyoxylase-like metal-dependent hydrolase (beta-lactamase superfamily II)